MLITGGVGQTPSNIGGTPVLRQTSWPAGALNGSGLSNGTDTWGVSQRQHVVFQDCDSFELIYVWAGADEHAAPPIDQGIPSNNGTISATIWKQSANPNTGGTPVDVTFGGSASYTIAPEQILVSDSIPGPFKKGDILYERTMVTVPSGGTWPLGTRTQPQGGTDGGRQGTGTPPVDYLHTGSITSVYPDTRFAACSSSSSTLASPVPIAALIGTSIAEGTSGENHEAHVVQACANANIPCVRLARGGESALMFNTTGNHEIRLALTAQATVIIVEHLTNDFQNSSDFTQCATRLRTLHQMLHNVGGGRAVIQLTGCPSYGKSTDGWTTIQNQTPSSKIAFRTAVHDWIRAGCPEKNNVPVAPGTSGAVLSPFLYRGAGGASDSYFEIADAVESSRNSGKWIPNYTGDGTHPNTTGHAAAALAVSTSILWAASGLTAPAPPPPPPTTDDMKSIQMIGGSMASIQSFH
jgi:lysophospholipase L1-like esterase